MTEEAGMGREQEPGGDYGYDLVHEEVRVSRRPESDRSEAPPAPEREASAGDYGYDEAHDF